MKFHALKVEEGVWRNNGMALQCISGSDTDHSKWLEDGTELFPSLV